jgi:peptidase M28-like protein/PDZ domain-containing protein
MKLSRYAGVVMAVVFAIHLYADPRHIDPRVYLEHIKYLASDDLEGRGDGMPGLEKAADYIGKSFSASGLEPAGDNGTFFQKFELVAGLAVQPGNAVTLTTPRRSVSLQIGRDYDLLSTSSDQSPASPLPVVFAGYGITATPLGYDDYADIDAGGKAVLIFTHEPQENDPKSRFDGQTNTPYSAVEYKAQAARSHGARAILLVDDPVHAPQTAQFRRWMHDPQAEEYGVPVYYLSRDRVQEALGTVLNFTAVQHDIDRDFAPHSQALSNFTVTAVDRTAKIRKPVRNVLGILKGSDPALQSEFVVVGAHYDHLGRSARFSMAPNSTGQIHHGADDNASGTAAVMEMAKAASEARADFRRSIVFIAFAGEEFGLLGSSYYVQHPAVPLEKTIAMINLDMVGRAGGRILVDGISNSPSIEDDLKVAQQSSGISLNALKGSPGAGASDDASFSLRKIPALNFFSGFHADYHRPSDTWEKIDARGGAAVADLALALARQLTTRKDRPEFIEGPQQPHGSSGSGSGAVSGYGPYFGSVPDFADEGQGVKFADVRAGSPAAKAGLRRGDVLTSFGGAPIKNLYDFTFALRDKKPGDKVEVTVTRDGKPITATVELTNRP